MKHFIVIIKYKADPEVMDELRLRHRQYLQAGYNEKLLLLSGPQPTRQGGVVICRAKSLEVIKQFFKSDPYKIADAAEYEIIEFTPVSHQPFLADWLSDVSAQ